MGDSWDATKNNVHSALRPTGVAWRTSILDSRRHKPSRRRDETIKPLHAAGCDKPPDATRARGPDSGLESEVMPKNDGETGRKPKSPRTALSPRGYGTKALHVWFFTPQACSASQIHFNGATAGTGVFPSALQGRTAERAKRASDTGRWLPIGNQHAIAGNTHPASLVKGSSGNRQACEQAREPTHRA